jgi:hypothetical protein
MKPITLQDILDAAWKEFILLNNPPAVKLDHPDAPWFRYLYSCAYTTPDGRHCAVGLVLPFPPADQSICFGEVATQTSLRDVFDPSVRNTGYDQINNFQQQLHDKYVDLKTGKWNASRFQRLTEYERVAMGYNLICPIHNQPLHIPHTEANELAAKLSFGELDGWSYTVEQVSGTHSIVTVRDEDGEFVSYWY